MIVYHERVDYVSYVGSIFHSKVGPYLVQVGVMDGYSLTSENLLRGPNFVRVLSWNDYWNESDKVGYMYIDTLEKICLFFGVSLDDLTSVDSTIDWETWKELND